MTAAATSAASAASAAAEAAAAAGRGGRQEVVHGYGLTFIMTAMLPRRNILGGRRRLRDQISISIGAVWGGLCCFRRRCMR